MRKQIKKEVKKRKNSKGVISKDQILVSSDVETEVFDEMVDLEEQNLISLKEKEFKLKSIISDLGSKEELILDLQEGKRKLLEAINKIDQDIRDVLSEKKSLYLSLKTLRSDRNLEIKDILDSKEIKNVKSVFMNLQEGKLKINLNKEN